MKDRLVTLVKYRYEYRAEILQDKLEDAGIKSSISNETVLGQIDGVRVMVMDKDYANALKVYRELRRLYDTHSEDIVEEPNDGEE